VAGVWALVLAFRNALHDLGILRSRRGALPTLVVGNVEVGGTGKTPHVLDLSRRLFALLGPGSVGVLSRGYRRTASGFQWVSDAASWHEVGDEPWMIQRQLPDLDVAVGADRIAALSRMAQERPSLRVVVLDDGLQHRALKPDRALALTSRRRPPQGLGWSRLLPAGPWRDLPSRLGKADVVVATTPVAASQPHDLTTFPTTRVPQLDRPVLLVTGIAQPHRVVEAALRHGLKLAGTAHYPDHHAFTERDVAAWASWMRVNDVTHVLTTAKDAVRMETWTASWTDLHVAVLELEVEWHAVEEIDAFLKSWTQSLPS